MAITGVSYSEKHWFCSKHDPCSKPTLQESQEAGATIFWWGAIPNIVMTRIADQQSSSTVEVGDMMRQTFNQRTASRNREAFRYGIRKPCWDNYFDETGAGIPAEFTTIMENGQTYEVLADTTLDRIHLSTIQEVGAHIFNSNSLGETQRKNLEDALSHSDVSALSNAMSAASKIAESGDVNDQPLSTDETSSGKPARPTRTGKTPRAGKSKTAALDD